MLPLLPCWSFCMPHRWQQRHPPPAPGVDAVTTLQTAFTGTIARGLSLVAIVIGGLMFAFGEGGSKRALARLSHQRHCEGLRGAEICSEARNPPQRGRARVGTGRFRPPIEDVESSFFGLWPMADTLSPTAPAGRPGNAVFWLAPCSQPVARPGGRSARYTAANASS